MRKTIVSTLYIGLALALGASCSRIEVDAPSDRGLGGTVITAVAGQIGAGTKVEMAYCYEARWQADDQIHVKQGTTTDTFTLTGGEGTTKGTFQGTKSMTGEIEAFYPVSVGKTMTWPEVQTNSQPAPMYAHQSITGAEGETVNFSSLGAMLQIVFNSTVENITLQSIELKDGGRNLSGAFAVDENGRAVISATDGKGVVLDLGAGKALGKGANFFYLSIPAGTYNDLTISFYTNDRRVCTMHSTTFPEVESNTVCRLTLTGTKFEQRNLSISGKFNVGGGRTVKFAKGNLFWNGDSFDFEDSQFDYPVTFDESHVGHFFWSNDAEVARAGSFDASGSGEHDVLFTNATESTPNPDFTVNGVKGDFRTLSALEWDYLLDNQAHKYVTVGDRSGIAIAPDTFTAGLEDSYDAATWAALEAAGVVFLPSASYRFGGKIYSKGDTGYLEGGRYWSSAPWTYQGAQAVVWFATIKDCSCADLTRDDGCCIRLVEDMVYATGVSLDKTTLTMYAHQNAVLTATVLPGNAPDKTVLWTSDNTDVATVDGNGKVSAVSAGTATITATTADRGRTASCTVTVVSVSAGRFTVDSQGTTVRFALGNLYWDGDSFEFEVSQLAYPTGFNASHVGHFFWSNNAETARAASYSDPGRTGSDVLFTNATESTPNPDFTVAGVTGEYRTLSQLEWQYLLDNNKKALVTVEGRKCLAIAPDGYAGSISGTYDAEGRMTAESAGMVFLPAAGKRDGSSIDFVEDSGRYWTSSPWNTNAQSMIFYETVRTYSDRGRDNAKSIRLVKND